MSDRSQSPLHALESMSSTQVEAWLRSALQGTEPLPLATPDEPPFEAIAHHESSLSDIRRRDLRQGLAALTNDYVRSGDEDDAYVASLLGLVNELDERRAEVPLFQLATSDRFEQIPVRQQAQVLGTLIDLHVELPAERWIEWALAGRHHGLALTALLRSQGPRGLDLLPKLRVDQRVADTLALVLSQHSRKLDPLGRERMVRRGFEVVGKCTGEVRAAVQEWLQELGEPVVEIRVSSSSGRDFVVPSIIRNKDVLRTHCAVVVKNAARQMNPNRPNLVLRHFKNRRTEERALPRRVVRKQYLTDESS